MIYDGAEVPVGADVDLYDCTRIYVRKIYENRAVITVQKVAATEDEKRAASVMKLSMTYRMLFQILWIAAAILAPCFYWIAGVAPLLFPSFGIKISGIFGFNKKKKSIGQEVDTEQNGD